MPVVLRGWELVDLGRVGVGEVDTASKIIYLELVGLLAPLAGRYVGEDRELPRFVY